MRFRLVRSDHGSAAGSSNDGCCICLCRSHLGEESGGLHQRFELIHEDHAISFERGAIGRVRTGERSGVRHGGAGALFAFGDLVQDEGLVGRPCQSRCLNHAVGVIHPLEQAGDGPTTGIFHEIGNEIGDIDIAAVAGSQHMTDLRAAFYRLYERVAERAGLADDANGMGGGSVQSGFAVESDVGANREVGKADAVGTDDPNTAFQGDAGQFILFGNSLFGADLGKAGRVDDAAADTCASAFPNDIEDLIASSRHHHAIGNCRQCTDGGVAGPPGNLFVTGIDLEQFALKVRESRYRSGAKR